MLSVMCVVKTRTCSIPSWSAIKSDVGSLMYVRLFVGVYGFRGVAIGVCRCGDFSVLFVVCFSNTGRSCVLSKVK